MQTFHEITDTACRLTRFIEDEAARGCDEYDPAYEEAERQFAELRLEFAHCDRH